MSKTPKKTDSTHIGSSTEKNLGAPTLVPKYYRIADTTIPEPCVAEPCDPIYNLSSTKNGGFGDTWKIVSDADAEHACHQLYDTYPF